MTDLMSWDRGSATLVATILDGLAKGDRSMRAQLELAASFIEQLCPTLNSQTSCC